MQQNRPAQYRFFGEVCYNKIADTLETSKLSALRLTVYYGFCVFAFGSFITSILNYLAFANVLCLHLGQKNGKFLMTVSVRSLSRVLLPHIGYFIHFELLSVFKVVFSVLSFYFLYKLSHRLSGCVRLMCSSNTRCQFPTFYHSSVAA